MGSEHDQATSARLTRTGTAPDIGMVHIGPGAFFRAFTAIYTHEAMQRSGGDWGISAVSLKSSRARDQFAGQDGVYSSVSLDAAERRSNIIESVAEVLVASEELQAVLMRLADPKVRIVTLTVTEKGYCHHPATGRLNLKHPDVVHDLANPDTPRSAPGLVVAGLALRRAAGIEPFAVVSCDNLPANGALVRQVVIDLATADDTQLAEWIKEQVRFVSTMVDRITPAVTDADIDALFQAEGYRDLACVVHEPFRQWVIEDNFAGDRPAWEHAGAQLVASVEAHELMKLRCLNGTHSALAYLGFLAGHETISDVVADPVFERFVRTLWRDEILPVVPCPEHENLEHYCASLFERYANTAIKHRTWQIAMDGSQKLPQRILGTTSENLERGRMPQGLCLAIAAWMVYVGGRDEAGQSIDVRDPMARQLAEVYQQNTGSAATVSAMLQIDTIFNPALAGDEQFKKALIEAHERLVDVGARASIEELLQSLSAG